MCDPFKSLKGLVTLKYVIIINNTNRFLENGFSQRAIRSWWQNGRIRMLLGKSPTNVVDDTKFRNSLAGAQEGEKM